jgi:UDP-N-acetylglucosamine 1-carboxyvinyltransferase
MKKFIVEGGHTLSGEINPVGNKNAVLKLIPASILFSGDYTLTNVPAISDVDVMVEILTAMGASVNYQKQEATLTINTDNLNTHVVPVELAQKIRASVLFVGPLLARFGKAKSVFPGGDKIGPRELKAHFESLAQLGVELSGNEWGEFELAGNMHPGEVYLYEPSVTATENVILAAAKLDGVTAIKGAAAEPHVQELCLWLNENGVRVDGIGSSVLYIHGNANLSTNGKTHAIWPDYIDVATSAVAAAITGGEVRIKNVRKEDMVTIEFFYDQMGLNFVYEGTDLIVKPGQLLKLKDAQWGRIKGVYSQPWYGFPSDLMSISIVLAMAVQGSTLFFEKLYPDRMAFVSYFNAAGGNIIICDPHRIVINGATKLRGFKYHAPDLRAGMSYFLAALASEGKSEITGVEHIERGYPDTVERYRRLGANIESTEA